MQYSVHTPTEMRLLFVFAFVFITDSAKSRLPHTNLELCPHHCICYDVDSSVQVVCEVMSSSPWSFFCQDISNYVRLLNHHVTLKLTGDLSDFDESWSCLPEVQSLDLSGSSLVPKSEMFKNLNSLLALNLSFNAIQNLPTNVLLGLSKLSTLDLSHNNLLKLDPLVFDTTPLLTTVDVSYNNLSAIPNKTFSALAKLQELNLDNNVIQELSTMHISNCVDLKKLNLRSNFLKKFLVSNNETEISNVNNLHSLDLSNNPLECSCMLGNLLQHLPALVAEDSTVCDTPSDLQGKSIKDISLAQLTCTNPHGLVVRPANETSILVTTSVVLRCSAKGYPAPSIMWVTPWGDKFFYGLRETFWFKSFYLSDDEEVYTFREYEEPNVDITTTIQIDDKNNLIITKFRGSMVGNFTCLAFNEAGNFSLHLQVSVFSNLKSVVIQSLFIGGYCSSGFFVLGLVVGLIKALLNKLRHRFYFIVPLLSKAASHRHPDDTSSSLSIEESNNNGDGNQGPGNEQTSCSILVKCSEDATEHDQQDSSDGSNSPREWRPSTFLEYLEDSKGRLRHGVGRKIQRVRKNVQSFRESGSVYVHNIVESGSSAARTMRAGVVMGVETVKYHVQSFKELCGTGDMGTQTISMVSVETDVDSNQSKEIIKQVTFV
ncbi:hypothetical protein Btru_030445 [Bulinus truncatus]|nr:hypothetical protein Btru_030445 [Bulinus truncatus]